MFYCLHRLHFLHFLITIARIFLVWNYVFKCYALPFDCVRCIRVHIFSDESVVGRSSGVGNSSRSVIGSRGEEDSTAKSRPPHPDLVALKKRFPGLHFE